eukprot:355655-Chlamydomonas_euryale.AAC.2
MAGVKTTGHRSRPMGQNCSSNGTKLFVQGRYGHANARRRGRRITFHPPSRSNAMGDHRVPRRWTARPWAEKGRRAASWQGQQRHGRPLSAPTLDCPSLGRERPSRSFMARPASPWATVECPDAGLPVLGQRNHLRTALHELLFLSCFDPSTYCRASLSETAPMASNLYHCHNSAGPRPLGPLAPAVATSTASLALGSPNPPAPPQLAPSPHLQGARMPDDDEAAARSREADVDASLVGDKADAAGPPALLERPAKGVC